MNAYSCMVSHPPDLSGLIDRIDAATAALPTSPDRALRELRAARALASGLDAGASATLPDVPPPHAIRLTKREGEVLLLLARGDRNKEIAFRLQLRERTVKFHVANLLRKFDAGTRTEALRRAVDLGFVPRSSV